MRGAWAAREAGYGVSAVARATGESSDVELIAGPVIFFVQHNGSPIMSHIMADDVY